MASAGASNKNQEVETNASSIPADACKRVKVGVLGATGAVGQRFLCLLHNHPYFRVAAVGGSSRSAGKRFAEAVTWRQDDDKALTEEILQMTVLECTCPALFRQKGCALIFSALDAAAADELEELFAREGFMVFSNAKSHRMDPDVPILLPYVNAPLLDVVRAQAHYVKARGGIVTNANCASTGLVVALRPLLDRWGITRLSIATLQAISGAGYPGLSAMDMVDNVIPFISGEEEKLEREPQKMLGSLGSAGRSIQSASFESVAMCHRVPVVDGHTVTVTVDFPSNAFPDTADPLKVAAEVTSVLGAFEPPKEVTALPSCPTQVTPFRLSQVILVCEDPSRPQPRIDRLRGNGMSVSVGPVKAKFLVHSKTWSVKFTTLVHNTVLGAAGCAILNAELALHRGMIRDPNNQDGILEPVSCP
ncbi:aspartate-semialdehyde dehydrogenase [Cystoisospora suis]|uniref:Aspartate-semialdehyde dehydrogenase n=1 Tax=Cystoisospora suis TaxID=483139 RepID=A0A2C6L7G8_9APIC|nr:aspartate-semialdehyde dehydrogenase [Cystoisospora suis]